MRAFTCHGANGEYSAIGHHLHRIILFMTPVKSFLMATVPVTTIGCEMQKTDTRKKLSSTINFQQFAKVLCYVYVSMNVGERLGVRAHASSAPANDGYVEGSRLLKPGCAYCAAPAVGWPFGADNVFRYSKHIAIFVYFLPEQKQFAIVFFSVLRRR